MTASSAVLEITLEGIDQEGAPGCQIKLYAYNDRECGNPAVARLRFWCGICRTRKILFVCRICLDALRQGKVDCGTCRCDALVWNET